MLNNLNWEGNRNNNDLASLGHILASMDALFKLRDETFMFISRISKIHLADSDEDMNPCNIPELTFRIKVHQKVLQKLVESRHLSDICSQKLMDLEEEVRSILTNSGHCDPTDLYPQLEKGNQDQIVILNMILEGIYPNGRENHIVVGSSQNTAKNQNPTNELPNMSLDSEAIKTEAPKNDMITVDLNTLDTQLNPKPNSMPKKTMIPRYKFKRIKKGGKVQKIQFPRVHKRKFKPSHKITDSQNTPIKSPNISCDSTVSDTGIPEGDSSKMVLGVQNTKQNYKTKALKMSKGSVPQMLLVKRRKTCGKIKKFQTPRMSKKKLKSQLDMGAQWSLKSKHNNNARLHDNTLNTKFIELRGIMESVMGAFHNTFPLQDRLLLKRPRVKIK